MIQPEIEWRNYGAKHGLYVLVASNRGHEIHVATNDSAQYLVSILNQLEKAAAFGHQCYQDRCENAYVEVTIYRNLESVLAKVRNRIDAVFPGDEGSGLASDISAILNESGEAAGG